MRVSLKRGFADLGKHILEAGVGTKFCAQDQRVGEETYDFLEFGAIAIGYRSPDANVILIAMPRE